jgi:hypothetical protein
VDDPSEIVEAPAVIASRRGDLGVTSEALRF